MNLKNYQSNLDRGASAFTEATWWFIRAMFFLIPLPFPSKFRAALLRLFGAKVGKRTIIRHGVSVSFPWRLEVGDDVWLGEGVKILSLAPVILGNNVCISQESFLCTGSHDYRDEAFSLITKPITIADKVWIAARCFIGPGVNIHEGAVIGAGSVIMRDIPPHTLACGNPAKVIHNLDR